MHRPLIALPLFAIFISCPALAQDEQEIRGSTWNRSAGVPVLTGDTGFTANFRPGRDPLGPTATPILLVPSGERWLVEAKGEFENGFEYEDGT